MSPTTTRHRTAEAILEDAGFTPAQIARLRALREIYPLPEFLETGQIRRLAFLKWELRQRATTTVDQTVS
ncbi:MAG: hypothetical protein DCC58_14365 [Chloroflexi bacterium]|nr:MAG: hypothetical protein DCC58_14365 [Chloroflexota bacterium]